MLTWDELIKVSTAYFWVDMCKIALLGFWKYVDVIKKVLVLEILF